MLRIQMAGRLNRFKKTGLGIGPLPDQREICLSLLILFGITISLFGIRVRNTNVEERAIAIHIGHGCYTIPIIDVPFRVVMPSNIEAGAPGRSGPGPPGRAQLTTRTPLLPSL